MPVIIESNFASWWVHAFFKDFLKCWYTDLNVIIECNDLSTVKPRVFEEHRLDSTTTDITTALFILYIMSLYYLILWNQVDILQIHFKKDHVHMRLWTRFYSILAHWKLVLSILGLGSLGNYACYNQIKSSLTRWIKEKANQFAGCIF